MSLKNRDNIEAYGALSRASIDQYGEEGDFGKKHLLNPHLLRLIGSPNGRRILDAGSGTGYLSRMIARQGGIVTGLEPSEAFHHYCTDRESKELLNIEFVRADLSTFKASEPFDVVVSSMVLMDIPEWESALTNCVESLVPGGKFVIAITHPCFEDAESNFSKNGSVTVREYFDEYVIPQNIGYRIHRPISLYVNLAIRSGCTLEEMVEPKLDRSFGSIKDVSIPSYLILAFRKL